VQYLKIQTLLVIAPLLLLAIFAAPRNLSSIPSAHAQLTGVVCVAAQGTSTSGCPAVQVNFARQAQNTHLIVAINIAGSDALNGFRIFIKTNNAVLNPISADIANTLLAQPVLILANCVNGAGTGCSLASGDGPGVVDVGAVSLAGLSTPPTTGGLFEITYNVAAPTGTGFTSLDAVAGLCIGTSVTGLCVTITNGGSTPNVETFQAGSYGLAETPPTISAPSTVSTTQGFATTFTVTASDADGNPSITIAATGLPSGASFTTSGTNPATGTFSWTPAAPQSVTVTFTATDNAGLTATTSTTINVSPLPVRFYGGKLSWTHHLSLAKNSNMQTWSAKVTNPGAETAYAIVTIQGTNGVLSFTAQSAMITLVGGAALVVPITQTFDSTSIGTKYHFTATIMWGTSPTAITFPGANMKSGAFAVVA